MGNYEFAKTETKDKILLVTINRPEVYNAVHPPLSRELDEIWNDFLKDPDLWVAILTGAGEKAFSAGNDLKYSAQAAQYRVNQPASGFAGLTNRFDRTKPIIAAVNGFAMGGGMETALSCDIIIVSENETIYGTLIINADLPRVAGLKGTSKRVIFENNFDKYSREYTTTGRKKMPFKPGYYFSKEAI